MAKKLSRRARNQAKWDAHAASHTADKSIAPRTVAAIGGAMGGNAPSLHTGSIQSTPSKPTVTQRKGIRLQPFTDYVPRVPSDYATVPPSHMNEKILYNQETGARIPQSTPPRRDRLAIEIARTATRPVHESKIMHTDGTSGGESMVTYDQRHESDTKAGLYRDGMGRVMRTTDMADADATVVPCAFEMIDERTGLPTTYRYENYLVTGGMTTTDYASMHNVPVRRDGHTRGVARAAERVAIDERKAARAVIRDQKEADRLQRRADRIAGKSGAHSATRADLDTAARAYLAAMDIENPTPDILRAARDVITHAKQIAQYVSA